MCAVEHVSDVCVSEHVTDVCDHNSIVVMLWLRWQLDIVQGLH